ncbi:uncharacterized protein LOC124466343 [Hypomesus transpacificus]|uniref:uncharacterized protein LOC124466343 n=1 Tax=Hypomesus transpacificus TaxID=137520 RepID=UPI001F0801A4|nr:uncharacterized protein LOC124466343 [Hypomesus transpacificus]
MSMMLKVDLSLESPFIEKAECNCKAGQGHCAHVIGLLYTVAHYIKLGCKSVPPVESKTSLPQTWHIPRRSMGLSPKPITEVQINKIKPQQNDFPPAKQMRSERIVSNLYCPVPLPLPCKDFAQRLKSNLNDIGSTCQLVTLMNLPSYQPQYVPSPYGDVPLGSILSYQTRPAVIQSDDYPPFPLPPQPRDYATVLGEEEMDYYSGISMTQTDSELLENETRGQSMNKVWHRVRSQRITSSNFKRVCSRRADFDSLAAELTRNKKTVQTKAMWRGIEMEPVAAAKYTALTGTVVLPCGFVVNPNAPHLGASPDGRVIDQSEDSPYGLLEIKCPDKSTCADCPYLIRQADGDLALKVDHEYQFQILGQMGVSGAKWCDFFVMSHNDFHLERLHFDVKKWEEVKSKLDYFYFQHFLPALFR